MVHILLEERTTYHAFRLTSDISKIRAACIVEYSKQRTDPDGNGSPTALEAARKGDNS